MNALKEPCPVVLTLAGHDPLGGAGIQADIESILANHCRPVSIITCLTAQNRHGMGGLAPQKAEDFRLQLKLLMDEVEINAIKIGVIGSTNILDEIIKFLDEKKSIPVVFDPVLCASGGGSFIEDKLLQKIKDELIPRATILTPNSTEAYSLSQDNHSMDNAAQKLIALGCDNVLITGTHEATDSVINTLYRKDKPAQFFNFERLAGEFHGSGCTLSAAITAQLALGQILELAVENALDFTWKSLANAAMDKTNYGIPKRI